MERNLYPVSANDYRQGDPVLVPRSAIDKGSEKIEVWHFNRMNDDGSVDLQMQSKQTVDGVKHVERLEGNDARVLDEKTQAHYATRLGESRPGLTPEQLERPKVDAAMANIALETVNVDVAEADTEDNTFEVGEPVSFVLYGQTIKGHILDIRSNGSALVVYGGEGDNAKAINRNLSSLSKIGEQIDGRSGQTNEESPNESQNSEKVSLKMQEEKLMEQLSKLHDGLSDSDRTALHMFSASLYVHEEDSARSKMSSALGDDTSRQHQAQAIMRKLSAVREKMSSIK